MDRWYDYERREDDQFRLSQITPAWCDGSQEPCGCNGEYAVIAKHTGYSDDYHELRGCLVCGKSWVYWLEG